MAEDIRVAAFLHAKPGQESDVREAALAFVPPTRAEADNQGYLLHRDAQDPSLFVFVGSTISRRMSRLVAPRVRAAS